LPGGAGAVVPQAAAALVGAEIPLAALLGVVPDLHLRRRPQVDAAVGQGDRLVVDEQFDVAVFLVGGQVVAVAVVDQFALVHRPVFRHVHHPAGAERHGLGDGQRRELGRVEVWHAVPAVEVLSVEEEREPLGRRWRLGARGRECDGQGGKKCESVAHRTVLWEGGEWRVAGAILSQSVGAGQPLAVSRSGDQG
jgi:hypothetical protein